MKFSKEGNKRTVVALNQGNSPVEVDDKTQGQIMPLGKYSLQEYVAERVEKVKFLYSVLGPCVNSDLDRKLCQEARNWFNAFMKIQLLNMNEVIDTKQKNALAVQKTNNTGLELEEVYKFQKKEAIKLASEMKSQMNTWELNISVSKNKKIYTTIKKINMEISDEWVHQFVIEHLRGSLRKQICVNETTQVFLPDVIETMVCAVCREKNPQEYMQKIPSDVLAACLDFIFEDYMKHSYIKNVTKSIENQDTKVQVFGQREDCRLKIAGAEHKNKRHVFEFMEKYACAKSEEREEMRREIRRLIVLFFCGQSAWEELEDKKFSLWKFDFLKHMVSDIPSVLDEECVRTLSDEETVKKNIEAELKKNLRQNLNEKYRLSVMVLKEEDGYDERRFWLEYIEHDAEKLLNLHNSRKIKKSRLSTLWLCENVWKDFTAFLASKFVDMGKAVYHFAMPDFQEVDWSQGVKPGQVLKEYQNGITSFDYERISAEERLDRHLIMAITFALHNFTSAVCESSTLERKGNSEDLLGYNEKQFVKVLYPNVGWHLLQYFGGASTWEGNETGQRILGEDCSQFALELKTAFAAVRNASFHYAALARTTILPQDSVMKQIFQKEQEGIGAIYRKRYFSNNVPLFYSVQNIDNFMSWLYEKESVQMQQIPSFQSVLSRRELPTLIQGMIDGDDYNKIQSDADVSLKFHNMLYFVLKEIYYQKFIQEKELKKWFMSVLRNKKRAGKDKTERIGAGNLIERIAEYEKMGEDNSLEFSEMCQKIMTDYNLQNQQKKVRTNKDKNMPKEKYVYFKMLLLNCIQEAFLTYCERLVGNNKLCKFLKAPKLRASFFENLSEEEFCKGWEIKRYSALDAVQDDAQLIYWFMVAHFMTPKHLNHLRGEIKSYFSYIHGIEDRRYMAMGVRVPVDEIKQAQYRKILEILDLAAEYNGRISANWKDYYTDELEYAENIQQYLNFGNLDDRGDLKDQLHSFCNEKNNNSPSGYIGIFYDGDRPVLNRNVVRVRMYGTEMILAKALVNDKVQKEEILEYYRTLKMLKKDVFKKCKCENIGQERKRRRYQQQKNRIELVDILKYSEILNDLMSQLISWCYLRERDRMYFQIGFYYVALSAEASKIPKDSKLRILKGKGDSSGTEINITDNAVLYQMAAVYTYELPVYCLDEEGNAIVSKSAPRNTLTANGVRAFCQEYCREEWANKDTSIYENGLELFESPQDERDIIELRNYIDHFKYYARRDRSILELYSKVFERFFKHDVKLKKSVTVILSNILARYFVIPKLSINYREEEEGEEKHKITEIDIVELKTDVTIHKYEEKEANNRTKTCKKTLDYYNEGFLNRLQKVLTYNQG